ncbi:MAG: PQQ-dependent sugar dehydrogenase [Chloroflexota bacterium]
MRRYFFVQLGTLLALLLASCAMPGASSEPSSTDGAAALGASQAPPLAPVTAEGLPHPLYVPDGFAVSLFAKLPGRTRFMAFSPQGVLYAAVPEAGVGAIVALPDEDRDGRADLVDIVANELLRPHDIEFHDGALWVAQQDAVLKLTEPDPTGYFTRRETVLGDLPYGGNHWTKTIGFGPDGKLYLSIGSSCNVCIESDWRRAAITRYNVDGSDPELFATGMRNAVDFTWNERGELVATNNGRDEMGDEIPPDAIYITTGGEDFGWPRCHAGDIPDPEFGGPDACDGVAQPAFRIPAHSAPLGLTFYNGDQFPPDYRGDLLVALHGSFNRAEKTGYKVVRIRMEDGRPVSMEDFITGWLVDNNAWGRPVGVVVGPDGALYVSDDLFDAIYRVTYEGPR